LDIFAKAGFGTGFDESTILWLSIILVIVVALLVGFLGAHFYKMRHNPSKYSPALIKRWAKKTPHPETLLKVWLASNDEEKAKIGELAANMGWADKYMESLGGENSSAASVAIVSLWNNLQVSQADILKELVEATASTNTAKSMASVALLKKLADERTIPLLLVALLQREKYLPARICEALLPFGEAAGRALAALFDKVSGEDALLVLDSLGQMGKYCPLHVLVQAMHSQDIAVRQRAAVNTALVNPQNPVTFMEPLLNDKEPKVRAAATAALAEIGGDGEHQEIILELKKIYERDQDWQVKSTCQAFLSRWEDGIMADIAVDEAHMWLKDEEVQTKPRGTFAERYPEDK
jgi:HEAT repeat protein